MRKILFFSFIYLLVQSCSIPNYVIQNKAQTSGLDFTKGKWLINDVDCPGNVYKELTAMSLKDFGKYLENRLYPAFEIKEIILPQKIGVNPSKKTLMEMKKGCVGFDYFINISAGKIKENVGGLDITPQNLITKPRSNQSEVLIEVYDLNLTEVIYSQKVTGTINVSNDHQDVHFTKTNRSLILGAYHKIMLDIDKKSIKN